MSLHDYLYGKYQGFNDGIEIALNIVRQNDKDVAIQKLEYASCLIKEKKLDRIAYELGTQPDKLL